MTSTTKRHYPIAKMVCPVCHKFVINHLPWELIACNENNPKWYSEMLDICTTGDKR